MHEGEDDDSSAVPTPVLERTYGVEVHGYHLCHVDVGVPVVIVPDEHTVTKRAWLMGA